MYQCQGQESRRLYKCFDILARHVAPGHLVYYNLSVSDIKYDGRHTINGSAISLSCDEMFVYKKTCAFYREDKCLITRCNHS